MGETGKLCVGARHGLQVYHRIKAHYAEHLMWSISNKDIK